MRDYFSKGYRYCWDENTNSFQSFPEFILVLFMYFNQWNTKKYRYHVELQFPDVKRDSHTLKVGKQLDFHIFLSPFPTFSTYLCLVTFLRKCYSKNADFENTGLSGLKNKISFVLVSVNSRWWKGDSSRAYINRAGHYISFSVIQLNNSSSFGKLQ